MTEKQKKEPENKPCHGLLVQLIRVLEAKGSTLSQEGVQLFFLFNNFNFILGKTKGKVGGLIVAGSINSKLEKRMEELLEQYKRYT